MNSASVSPHGFLPVRGRGYRPEQADAYTAALFDDRDAAWERAARLTVLAREMAAEAEQWRRTVEELPPQTYEALGEGARHLFATVQEEAEAVRERARNAARECAEQAEAYAAGLREAARAHADSLRTGAEEYAGDRLLAARAVADQVRIAARRDVKECRAETLAVLRGARQRADAMLAELDREHTGRWTALERETGDAAAALDAHLAERVARAEAALAEAERDVAKAEESGRRWQEEARARGAEIIADARIEEERVSRETERVLREHGERWDTVQAQMDDVRNSLAALTGGRAPVE
ncbi:cellulose-binding protein [Streptomyces cadmiisoli]|uniref:Cellulose-binding protein n=1 Tax=Streptomyces cadmiisoli TaxID=2184053 RepID=A0A2Z4J379_9ACTN|nr:cellulose-binding protein [Streptomyces cadmiisoli]AWW39168.1 cellulose-binding protein [Streptomyces cadmiisoli]